MANPATEHPFRVSKPVVQSKEELFKAVRELGLPLDLEAIWRGEVPPRIKHVVQSPSMLFTAFARAPEMFPAPDLLILWGTNGDSIVGYLSAEKVFLRFYPEDGPERYEVLGSTYQQMLSDLFAKLIMANVDDETLLAVARFFSFRFVTELKQFMAADPSWEGNTATFIAKVEANVR